VGIRPGDADPDRGSIVVGWLVRITAVLAVIGLVGFDAIALGVGRMGVADGGAAAARAAQDTYDRTGDRAAALAAADATAAELGVTLVPGSVALTAGGGVVLTATDQIETLLVRYIPPLQDWTQPQTTIDRPPRA
jgi:hypothetical protein